MDYLFLPYLRPQDPLTHALRRMRRTDSRAAVVEQSYDISRLYMNKEILEAWSDGKTNCSELSDSKGKPLVDLGATPIKPWPAPFPPATGWDRIEEFLEQQLDAHRQANPQAKYGILLPWPGDARAKMALVVSRHEHEADEIRDAAKVCRCSHNRKHIKQCPPASDNAPCALKCGGTYKCY